MRWPTWWGLSEELAATVMVRFEYHALLLKLLAIWRNLGYHQDELSIRSNGLNMVFKS